MSLLAIQHAWTVLCQKSVTDKDSNNISLDVLEQLQVRIPLLPEDINGIVVPFYMEVVSLWYRKPSDDKVKSRARLRIIASNKEEVAGGVIDIDLTSSHRSRTQIKIESLPVPKGAQGNFYFIIEKEVSDAWVEVASIPLEIILQEIEQKK